MDYKVNGESIFTKYETRRYATDNRTAHAFTAQTRFLADGKLLNTLLYNQLLVSADPASMISPNTERLIGYKNVATMYDLTIKGTRPQLISSGVSGGSPTTLTSHLMYVSSAVGSFNVTRTATAWTFNTTVVSAPYKEVFVEIVGGGGGGSAAGATSLGNRGAGGGGGAWGLYRIRLDVGQTMTITIGGGGSGSSGTSNAGNGGASTIAIGTETAVCGGGNGGAWGGWGSNAAGGAVSGTSAGTYIKRVAYQAGGAAASNGNDADDRALSTNDGTPEANAISRSAVGGSGGSGGNAGGSSLIGRGGHGSDGGNGNVGQGYGAGGGGGGRDAGLTRKPGAAGTQGWVGIWY